MNQKAKTLQNGIGNGRDDNYNYIIALYDEVKKNISKSEIKTVRNKYWRNPLSLGFMTNYYSDGCSFSDFYYNLLSEYYNTDNVTNEHHNLFLDVIKNKATKIYKQIESVANTSITQNDIYVILLYTLLIAMYDGFQFEYYIKCLIQNAKYEVYKSHNVDINYAIDFIVTDGNKKIGLQLKSQTYKNMYQSTKEKHYNKHMKAINNSVVDNVFYLLHNEDNNIVSINDDVLINTKKMYYNNYYHTDTNIVCKEKFINDLIELFN